MRKTLKSDEPVQLDDILRASDDGGPEEEKPYDPMPERQQTPKPPEEEPIPEEEPLDDDGEEEENEPSEAPPTPAEDPAQPAARLTPLAGMEYSAPVVAPNPPAVTYRSRISIVEAWRYPGQLAEAPDYVDRSWTAWADGDLYGHPAGPALKIPVTSSLSGPLPPDGCKLARIGDYVVRQMVAIVGDLEEETIDVWPKQEFERLFVPVTPKPKRKAA